MKDYASVRSDWWELLHWHLKDHCTRPDLGPERRGSPWTNEEFAAACGVGNPDDPRNAGRTVVNWHQTDKKKTRVVPNYLPQIERALFGENEAYESRTCKWRSDLGSAHGKAEKERSDRSKQDALGGDTPQGTRLVPLQWDQRAEDNSNSTPFASLSLRTGNSPIDPVPGQVHLGFDLHCPEDRTDTVVTSVKRCLLKFDCAGGRTGQLATRTGKGGGARFDDAHFTTSGTSTTAPEWEIAAIGTGGIGRVESVPSTFIQIDGLNPGCVVKAKIYASVKEVATTFVLPKVAAQRAKERIEKRLVALGIVADDKGVANLATAEIKLIAKPNAANANPKD